MRARRYFLAGLLLALAACAAPVQVLVPQADPALRLRPLVSSLEVRDISLPRYAASDDVLVLDDSGALVALRGAVWAETPERGLTLNLAAALERITGARVAAEPWPFAEPPQASVTVRVSQLTGTPGGTLDFVGSYAVAPVASGVADRSGRFDISVPVADDSAQAMARAQGQAMAQLAETIARRIGR